MSLESCRWNTFGGLEHQPSRCGAYGASVVVVTRITTRRGRYIVWYSSGRVFKSDSTISSYLKVMNSIQYIYVLCMLIVRSEQPLHSVKGIIPIYIYICVCRPSFDTQIDT